MNTEPKAGDLVVYVNEYRAKFAALVLHVWDGMAGWSGRVGLNLAYLDHDFRADTRPVRKVASVVHRSAQPAGANCWEEMPEKFGGFKQLADPVRYFATIPGGAVPPKFGLISAVRPDSYFHRDQGVDIIIVDTDSTAAGDSFGRNLLTMEMVRSASIPAGTPFWAPIWE